MKDPTEHIQNSVQNSNAKNLAENIQNSAEALT